MDTMATASDNLKTDLKEDKEDKVIIYVHTIMLYVRICITTIRH